jgi:hypothetical protein
MKETKHVAIETDAKYCMVISTLVYREEKNLQIIKNNQINYHASTMAENK